MMCVESGRTFMVSETIEFSINHYHINNVTTTVFVELKKITLANISERLRRKSSTVSVLKRNTSAISMRRNSSALCYVKEYIHCYYPKEFIHCLCCVKEYIHYNYVIDINVFHSNLMRNHSKKTETVVPPILLVSSLK